LASPDYYFLVTSRETTHIREIIDLYAWQFNLSCDINRIRGSLSNTPPTHRYKLGILICFLIYLAIVGYSTSLTMKVAKVELPDLSEAKTELMARLRFRKSPSLVAPPPVLEGDSASSAAEEPAAAAAEEEESGGGGGGGDDDDEGDD
jgi:hypothetical protein